MKKVALVLTVLMVLSSLGLHNAQAYNKEYVTTSLEDVRWSLKEMILNRETYSDILFVGNANYADGFEDGKAILNDLLKVLDSYDYFLLDYWNLRGSGYQGAPGYTIRANMGYREDKDETKYVESEAARIVGSITNSGMSAEQKIEAINEYVCTNSQRLPNGAESAFGTLHNRAGGSMGYALLGYKLLEAAGFEVTILKGSVGTHAWNYVKVNGQWKHVDFTWNDMDGLGYEEFTTDYLLKSDSEMGQTHRWDSSWKAKSEQEMNKPHASAMPTYDSQWVAGNRWDRVGEPKPPVDPPVDPVDPVDPTDPVEPVDPVEPPVEPVEPLDPSKIESGSPGAPVIYIDNKKINIVDQAPVIKDNRTLVPIRLISEALGADVKWNNVTMAVKISINGQTVELVVGSKVVYIGNRSIDIDVPPTIIGVRTMVPLRVISEAFGLKVNWMQSKYAVIISTTR